MKKLVRPHPVRRNFCLLGTTVALALGLPALSAQSQPQQPDPAPSSPISETIVLDPFTVNTAKDVGYMANSTLAGSRTNTEIKDLANPIDIFTAELMQDLAIEDIQDLAKFANGVSPNAAGDFNSDGQEREVWNYNYMEVRGFKVGSATRNFMELNAQAESYNTERVEFSKGPNSILFGSGSPGGSNNTLTKVPRLNRNGYSVTHKTDDLGSQRISTDLNQVLIKDKLALRLNTLWEDQEYYRRPGYERQTAWHLTGRWQPTRNTTLTLGYEVRKSNRASPRGIFVADRVSNWISHGSPIITAVSGSNVTVQGSTTPVSAASLGLQNVTSDTYILDSDGQVRSIRNTTRGNTLTTNSLTMDAVATGLDFPRNVWPGGPNGINDSDWKITEFNVTQRITDDWYADISYGHSNNDVMQGNSVNNALYVDPTGFGANTHPGEMYVETQPFWIDRNFNIDDVRFTTSYDLDLTRYNKWLGRHQVAGMFEYNRRYEWQDNGRLTLMQTPAGPTTGSLQAAGLRFYIRDYLNPATGQFTARDLRSLYYSNGISQDGYVAEFVRRESYAAYNQRIEQSSGLGVLQSRWLSDHLITTFGWRKDKRASYMAPFVQNARMTWEPAQLVDGAPAGTTHPSYAYIPDSSVKWVEGISRNFGAVLHGPSWADWLSFTFNRATNFAPPTESNDIFGKRLAASTGESTDFGFRLDLLDGKLNVQFLHYETSEIGSPTNGGSINSPFNDLKEIEDILVANNLIPSTPLVGVFTTADRTGEGEELTIIGNPTPHWTFRLTASRLVNRQRNLAPDVRAYYAEHMPQYEAFAAQYPTLADSTTTLAGRIAEAKAAMALLNTREGVQVFPSSEYTVRFIPKYTFDRTSRFKGLSLGGNIRWTSAPIIGYYRVASNGSFDTSRSHRGDEQVLTDLFLSYQRRLTKDIDWRLQINVSNVFDKTDPYPVAAVNNVDAADFQWVAYRNRPIEGRVFYLTNTFSF